jgi:Peptidase family M28
MKHGIFCLYLICISFCSSAQLKSLNYLLEQVSTNSLKTFENKIAGQPFQGRMSASKGDSLVTQFIANLYKTYHLSNPFKTSNPYLQNVPLTHLDYSPSKLTVQGKEYNVDNQWTYFDGNNNLKPTTAEVVFIGYGISIPKFDELKDIDVAGKFVLMNWDSPKDSSGKDIIESKDMPNDGDRGNSLKSRKALGILLYSPDFKTLFSQTNDFRTSEPYFDFPHEDSSEISGGFISTELSNLAVGVNVDSVYSIIANSGKPHSFNTHKLLTLSIIRRDIKTSTKNIIGLIKGTDNSLPCIVLSAHHDHFGKIDGKIFYGADDNGSGTTALLEIARILGNAATKGIRPKRTIVFLSTGAEEQGLIGAYYYTANPVISLIKTYGNINIDMVGRVDSFHVGNKRDSNYMYCLYYDTSNKVFNSSKLNILNSACCNLVLDTLYDKKSKKINEGSLITRSDNFTFIKNGIPSVFFFGGFHKDYHQPTDTPDKINYPLLKHRTKLVLATLWQLANE